MAVTSDARPSPTWIADPHRSRRSGESPPKVGFQVMVTRVSHFVVVRPSGDLNRETSPKLALVFASLLSDHPSAVVLDLSGVTSLSLDRCWVIAEAAKLFSARGGDLLIQQPAHGVRAVLDVAGLASLIDDIGPTEAEVSRGRPVSSEPKRQSPTGPDHALPSSGLRVSR